MSPGARPSSIAAPAAGTDRAAIWSDAIGHAIAAGDVEQAASLLWDCALPRIARGDGRTVSAWLGRFGAAELAGHPLLALVAAASALADGDFYEAERWITLARSVAGDDRARAGVLLMQAAVGRRGVSEMGADAKAAAELVGPTARGSHCAWFCGVWPSRSTDDSPQARELLEEAAHLSASRAPLVQALSLAQAALLAAADDDRGRASLLAERARAQVGRCDLGDSPLVALVYAVSAQQRVHSGKLAEAGADLRQARRLLSASTDPSAWLEAECRVAAARAALRLNGSAAARELLGQAAGRPAGSATRQCSGNGSNRRTPRSRRRSIRAAARLVAHIGGAARAPATSRATSRSARSPRGSSSRRTPSRPTPAASTASSASPHAGRPWLARAAGLVEQETGDDRGGSPTSRPRWTRPQPAPGRDRPDRRRLAAHVPGDLRALGEPPAAQHRQLDRDEQRAARARRDPRPDVDSSSWTSCTRTSTCNRTSSRSSRRSLTRPAPRSRRPRRRRAERPRGGRRRPAAPAARAAAALGGGEPARAHAASCRSSKAAVTSSRPQAAR